MKTLQTFSYCRSCPRACRVDRSRKPGFCSAVDRIKVASFCLHRGEEPVVSGTRGSGTVFFSYCNLKCVYCQNYTISHGGEGRYMTTDDVIAGMRELQASGAHNINLVSPSQYALYLPPLIRQARAEGVSVPFIYNTNGYDSRDMVRALDGLIDVYMPDMKYGDDESARKYSSCADYTDRAKDAIEEMYRQVGPLTLDENGLARRGLIVRHLVLPHRLAGSFAVLDFLATVSCDIYLSIMSQYHPSHRACDYPELNRTITHAEYDEVVRYAQDLGFRHLFVQGMDSPETYLPDFSQDHPFE